MQELITAYKSHIKSKTYYIFVIAEFSNESGSAAATGYMPYQQRYGFVTMKSEDLVRTIAHELGHGAFGLEHTFDPEYGIDDRYNNLMGYGKGDTARLFKFQWDIAHNSKAGEDEFEDAEDVMGKNDEKIQFYIDIEASFGPQIGAEVSLFGVTLSGVAKFANVSGKRRFYLNYDIQQKKWSLGTEVELKNQNCELSYDILSLIGKSFLSEYGGREHPVFTKKIIETRELLMKIIETRDFEGYKKEEKIFVQAAALELHVGLVGLGIAIGAEADYKPNKKE